MWGRNGISVWAIVTGLLLPVPAWCAPVWQCEIFEIQAFIFDGDDNDSSGTLASCPTDDRSLSALLPSGASATAEFSHVSDDDSTTILQRIELVDPTLQATFALVTLGYFLLDFDEATHVQFDVETTFVEGNRGGTFLNLGLCLSDDPSVQVIGQTDLIFAPGGGTCSIGIESSLNTFTPGVFETVYEITATVVPEPASGVLLAAGLSGLALRRRRLPRRMRSRRQARITRSRGPDHFRRSVDPDE